VANSTKTQRRHPSHKYERGIGKLVAAVTGSLPSTQGYLAPTNSSFFALWP